MNNVGGSASVKAGISADIPDSSVAKIDIASKNPVQISGWIPEITTRPLEINAQIDAQVNIYTEIAVAVSLEVLGELFLLNLLAEEPCDCCNSNYINLFERMKC